MSLLPFLEYKKTIFYSFFHYIFAAEAKTTNPLLIIYTYVLP